MLTPAGHGIACNLANLYTVYCIVDPAHTTIFQARLGTHASNRRESRKRVLTLGKPADGGLWGKRQGPYRAIAPYKMVGLGLKRQKARQ